jgi:uncharacterized protein YjaG (DUF416 family)
MHEVEITIDGWDLLVDLTIEVFGSYRPATREQPEEGPEVDPTSMKVLSTFEEEGCPFKVGEEVLNLLPIEQQLDLAWQAFREIEEQREYDFCDC